MMNKILKILFPLIVVGSILCIVIVTMSDKSITDDALREVSPFDFRNYIEQKVNAEITDGTLDTYKAIYAVIETEEQMVNMHSNNKVLSPSDADYCYEFLFNKYFTEFSGKADRCFASSNWSNRDKIYNEAKYLINCRGVQSQRNALEKYTDYVITYRKICHMIDTCSSPEGYRKVEKANADYISKSPYINNTYLKEAKARAKKNWEAKLHQNFMSFKQDENNLDCSTLLDRKENLQLKMQNFGKQFSSNDYDFSQGLTVDLKNDYNELVNINCPSNPSNNSYYY